jgi:DNA-binding MurR/RpiR family transcriptional regulator
MTSNALQQRVLQRDFWAKAHSDASACFERLARLAVERPDVFAFDSCREIAEMCKVSQTSVVRFAIFNGFDGLRAMKTAFRDALKARSASAFI